MRRRTSSAWTPSPTSCSRCSRSSAQARPRDRTPRRRIPTACRSRSATMRHSARSRRSCSSRAQSASRLRAQYVDWAAIAPRRPVHPRDPRDPAYDWAALDADVARYGRAGLSVQLAFWHVPAWANGGAAPNAWPLAPQDLGDFAYATAPPLSAGAALLRLERAQRASVRGAQHRRGLRADGARRVRRRARRPIPRRRSPPATSRAIATRDAIPPRGRRACTPMPCPWTSSPFTPTRCGALRSRCAIPRTASTCWTCRRSPGSPASR